MEFVVYSPRDSSVTALRSEAAAGWARVGQSPKDTTIELTFAVKERNTHLLLAEVEAVSYPKSPRYGKVR